jgi:hypothetical protein
MLENLFNFLSDLFKSFFTFLKILIRSNFFLPIHKAKSDSCIILGNGPSLKKVLSDYSTELKNKTLLCVNKFPDTPAFELLKPQYCIFISKEFWEPGSIKKHQDVRDNIVEALIQKTTWPVTLFCPNHAKSNQAFIKKIKANSNIEICFFNITPIEGLRSINRFFLSENWGSPRPHNVLIPSILMGINAGFKNIYLVGADHSWLPLISVSDDNIAMFNNQHFYDSETSQKDIMHKNSRTRRLHEILDKFKLTFEGYFALKDYADYKNVNIYNCTPDSFIDAFERKKLEDVISTNH